MIVRYLTAVLFACTLAFSAHAQRSLDSLVSEAGAEWMFGQWQGQSENGDTVTLNISWDLEKHVVVLHVKAGDMESKGYTVVEAKSELPKYYSFDNRGSVGKGGWNLENGDLVLWVESESADRGPWKSGFVFSGSASTGLQIRMHGIESSGDLSSQPRMSFKFKKAK